MNLAEAIKQKKKAENLSTKDLAQKLNVKVDNLYKWEKGTKPNDPEDYIKVQNWLNGKLEIIPVEERLKTKPEAIKAAAVDDDEMKRSLVRTLENMSEDKIRSTAIIERLVALLETSFNSVGQLRAAEVRDELGKLTDTPAKPIDLSLDKKYYEKDKEGKPLKRDR